jgi:hypothetical protein
MNCVRGAEGGMDVGEGVRVLLGEDILLVPFGKPTAADMCCLTLWTDTAAASAAAAAAAAGITRWLEPSRS